MMNNERLTQEEIDALLDSSNQEVFPASPAIGDYFSSMEQDALGEIGNISFGSSATALSILLNHKVDITTPCVSIVASEKLVEEFPQPYVAIQVEYTDGFIGSNLLVIKQTDAAIIADLMLGGDGHSPAEDLSEIHLSAVQEAMNQMMGSAATSMSTVFNKRVDISPPSIELIDLMEGSGHDVFPKADLLVKVSFRLTIGNLIDSYIMQLLPAHFARSLVDELMKKTSPEMGETIKQNQPAAYSMSGVEPTVRTSNERVAKTASDQSYQAEHINDALLGGKTEINMQSNQYLGTNSAPYSQPVQVQPATFSEFEHTQRLDEKEVNNLNMLLDIPLQVTVELGRTNRSVKEILELSSGSIIELDKLAGEPVDILVNKRLIAKGEVVVIDENFGVRVTDIISRTDRLKKLK
ncbi:flagellar motor switch phosphatase FliY [Pradoshia sp. D12]|uniref:flagellar motor switch phosphatase FliY n=1 Tax=Bacillaceae TaxID=186817 RepID=UPI00111CB515|nr:MULTISPECIES: flagellar motor switch phosphatase FliY [Bacillaceae]QFK70989.1 flagellar motor switch phosphatase FliY [Pradoshia sp. D12]TPF72781.1 flagellar motor switch phosphatase FliY [Bacillus sp. D12]